MSRSSIVFAVAIILQLAGDILTQEDSAVSVDKPCTDFYTYACKVKNITELPYINSKQWIAQFIENYPLKFGKLSDVEEKFYKFRKHCTEPGMEDKKNFLKKYNPSVGGWPAFDKNWKADKFNLQNALAELHSSAFPTIFTINLRNERSSFKNIIEVKLIISDNLYREEFKLFMKRKLPFSMDNVDEVISDSAIVEGLYAAEKNSTDEDVLTDYEGLKKKIPEIDWDKQFENVYGQKVPATFPVKIIHFGLMKRLIPKIFQVEPKVMANYLLYRLGHFLPELDEGISTELCEAVIHQMIIKQYYSDETKDVVRSMLFSFFKTLIKSGNLFNEEDKYDIEKSIHEFVTEEVIPDIDNSIVDDYYKDVKVFESDCYFTALQLANAFMKLKGQMFFKREIDVLAPIKFQLMDTIINNLPPVLNKSSAIQFEVLTWSILDNTLLTYRNQTNFKAMQQCFEMQIDDKFAEHEMKKILKFQIFTNSYFNWASDKQDLLQLEERKYNYSSKMVLFERLMSRYCNAETTQEQNKFSAVFANLYTFSEVYNCPVGSQFNPISECDII